MESGVQWELHLLPPIHALVFFFLLAFDLKFQSGPVDIGLQTKAWWGIPALHPLTLTHFFLLLKIVCIIQFLIDSSWLLGMCFAVTHQHVRF